MKRVRTLCVLVLAGLLAACAATAPRGPSGASEPIWRARHGALAALQDWSFEGRIGVTIGEQGWHAALNWQQRRDGYDIRILNPLGQNIGWLQGGVAGVTLRTPDRKESRAADAEALMYAQFGWWVPVAGLRYWLRGLPDPEQPAETVLDPSGRLTQLRQDGWEITFSRYAQVDALELPDLLTLSNEKIRVKLVIDGWRLH